MERITRGLKALGTRGGRLHLAPVSYPLASSGLTLSHTRVDQAE